MGFGPPSRRPFLFLAENNMVFDWTTFSFEGIETVAVAIDSNVVLNMILKEDDRDTEHSPENFVRRELAPRIRAMVRKILKPFLRGQECSPPLEHETQTRACFGSSLPLLTVFAVCDNGAPSMKAYAHERRRGAQRNDFVTKLKEVMPLFCEVVCESAYIATGCETVNLSHVEGEGEYTCLRVLANYPFEKSLLLVASSDSDIILYAIKALQAQPELNLGMIVLNNAIWNKSQFAGFDQLKLVLFPSFVQQIRQRQVSLHCYTSAVALLLGNDFLPSFVKSTVTFSQLHQFICHSLQKEKRFSFNLFVRTLQAANTLNFMKSSTRIQVTIADKSEALKELHRVVCIYERYIGSASDQIREIYSSTSYGNLQGLCNKLLLQHNASWKQFYSEPAFKHFFLFNSGMTASSWRAILGKLAKQLENVSENDVFDHAPSSNQRI